MLNEQPLENTQEFFNLEENAAKMHLFQLEDLASEGVFNLCIFKIFYNEVIILLSLKRF